MNAGVAEPIFWGNQDWHRPDLGQNTEGNPFVATPEGDVIYKGDDRTGAESATGYDENVILTLDKAPARSRSTRSSRPTTRTPRSTRSTKTLGMATNVLFGCAAGYGERARGQAGRGQPTGRHRSSVHHRPPAGLWTMHSKQEGYTDSMIKVAQKLGVDFGQPRSTGTRDIQNHTVVAGWSSITLTSQPPPPT
ncbi:MAG: hypothetical protein U0491_02535 [Candidatus Saccharimonadales bacterium]